MSGSSGTGFSGNGAGSNVSCEDIVIHTQLASPKASVIVKISKGDILEIESENNPMNQPLIVAKFKGNIAGGITHSSMFRLLDCIKSGTEYNAEVLSVNLGIVKIKIYARK